jgi:hypothetical protein
VVTINICNDKTYCFVQNFHVLNYSTMAKKYVFRGIRFITMFNKSGHLFSPLFTDCFHKMKFLLSLHVCQGLPYGHIPCDLQTKILSAFSLSHFCHIPTLHSLFDKVTMTISGEEHKLLISALSTFFCSLVTGLA